MSTRLTRPMTLQLRRPIAWAMEEGELIQVIGLAALVLALAISAVYGARLEVVALTVIGIISIVAPETLDSVESIIRGRK